MSQQSQNPSPDPDVQLDLVTFPIPNLRVLKAVMLGEQGAIRDVQMQVMNIARSHSETGIVDPQGKVIPRMGKDISSEIRALVTQLIEAEPLRKVYVVAPAGQDGHDELQGFTQAGIKVSFLTFQGLITIMAQVLGPEMARSLSSQIDAVCTLTLQAAGRGRNPVHVLRKVLQIRHTDSATGQQLIGEPVWAEDLRTHIADLVLAFLVSGGYVQTGIDGRDLGNVLAKGEDTIDTSMTPLGEKLLVHLKDVISLRSALQTRGPELTKAMTSVTQAAETKSMSEVQRDFANPNAKFHEA